MKPLEDKVIEAEAMLDLLLAANIINTPLCIRTLWRHTPHPHSLQPGLALLPGLVLLASAGSTWLAFLLQWRDPP